jgi:hypothetical protein
VLSMIVADALPMQLNIAKTATLRDLKFTTVSHFLTAMLPELPDSAATGSCKGFKGLFGLRNNYSVARMTHKTAPWIIDRASASAFPSGCLCDRVLASAIEHPAGCCSTLPWSPRNGSHGRPRETQSCESGALECGLGDAGNVVECRVGPIFIRPTRRISCRSSAARHSAAKPSRRRACR